MQHGVHVQAVRLKMRMLKTRISERKTHMEKLADLFIKVRRYC